MTEALAAVVQARVQASASAISHRGDGNFRGLCGTHILQLTEASVTVVQARIKASASTVSHRGDGKLAGVAGTYRSLIDESRFGHVSHFPIGALGTFQGLCGTYRLWLTEAFAVVQARVKASTSAIFPSGRWEVFKVLCGTYILKMTEALAAVVQARIKTSA